MKSKEATLLLNNKSVILSWCLYDAAISAFSSIVITFIFATYFTSTIAKNEITGTYQWSRAMALASFLIALLSPVFGAIADYGGKHKRWLFLFTYLSIISTIFLWYAYPEKSSAYFTLAFVILGTISIEIATVFYNSFLPHIAPAHFLGRISGWGWGIGYWGGIIALAIVLFVFVKNPPPWLNIEIAEQVRITGPFTAIWIAIFSLPLFLFIPDTPLTKLGARKAISLGIKDLWVTLKTLKHQKNLLLFLIAHLIYADGLNTLFAFGGIYAAGTFHMPLSEVILFGIFMNISAGIGAVCLAWADDFFGSKFTILFSLTCLLFFGCAILLVKSISYFWFFALFISLFLGPVQAASRTLMAKLSPPEKSTEMFGLFAFSGRITAFAGPWLLGIVTLYFQNQRVGIATILLFFIAGGILMCFVREPKINKQLKLANLYIH